MEKKVLILSIILCLSSISTLKNYKISVEATQTPTWTVDANGSADFKTIQEAINNANPGDTIFVRNGIYYENVIINKTVILIGENRDFTIINGNETNSVVTIDAYNVTIQNFTIRKSGVPSYSGIFVKPPYEGNIIIYNNITENYYGVYLLSSNNVVSGNLIVGNDYGVYLVSCSGNMISGNLIVGNDYGVYLVSCSGNMISGNILNSNFYDGIGVQSSFNNSFSDNTISFNYLSGISLYDSKGNVVYGNVLFGNSYYGINLRMSSENVFSTNTIVENPYGIFAFSSNINIIFRNNFNNTVQVWSVNSINVWSCYGEGNYWSDYSGTDFYSGPNQDRLGSDGIGDVPYVIDETNIDKSPFMGVFFKFDITYEKEVYQVSTISNSTISDFKFQMGTETGNKIIRFKPTGNESNAGFCRIMIPTRFMRSPYIFLMEDEEIDPIFLDISNETHVYFYFTYLHKNQTVTIISSEWYHELLSIYYDLNATYHNFLDVYNDLLYNYTQLLRSFEQLNASYQYFYDLNVTFYDFLDDYARLQENFNYLNETYWNLTNLHWQLQMNFGNLSITYQSLLNAFVLLSGNYTQLLEDFQELNASYQEHLRSYSENVSNVKSLTYILAAWAAILIVVTAYLSKRAHSSSGVQKIKKFGEV